MAMKYHFKVDNHAWACVVLPVNGFGSASLIIIYGYLLLFANSARASVVAGVAEGYTGIE